MTDELRLTSDWFTLPQAARRLGLKRHTLYRRIKRQGIKTAWFGACLAVRWRDIAPEPLRAA